MSEFPFIENQAVCISDSCKREIATLRQRIAELESRTVRRDYNLEVLKERLHDIAFFSLRVDSRLKPDYESGWNDAVTEMTKRARKYFDQQEIGADDFDRLTRRDKAFAALVEYVRRLDGDYNELMVVCPDHPTLLDEMGLHEQRREALKLAEGVEG